MYDSRAFEFKAYKRINGMCLACRGCRQWRQRCCGFVKLLNCLSFVNEFFGSAEKRNRLTTDRIKHLLTSLPIKICLPKMSATAFKSKHDHVDDDGEKIK